MHGATVKAGEKFQGKAEEIHGVRYDYSKANYTGSANKVKLGCTEHGYFYVTPNAHLRDKTGCPLCNTYNRKSTRKEFEKEVTDIDSSYRVVGPYINALTHTALEHITCGHKWSITPNKFRLGRRCPICVRKEAGKSLRKTDVNYKQQLATKFNNEITSNEKYIKDDITISHTHNCGYTWKATPNSIIYSTGCPKCARGSDNDAIYLWRVAGTDIYKIGVTSNRLKDKRIYTVAARASKMCGVTIIPEIEIVLHCPNALEIEKLLLTKFTSIPTNMPKGMDGYTEFRVLTKEEVVEALKIITA